MKIAFIADVHGNSWALNAVLQDIHSRQIKTIYDLGDSLYGPLDPAGTFQLFQKYGILSLAGNNDRYILEIDDANPTHSFVLKSLAGTDALQWLNTLPAIRSVNNLFLCHGTPFKDDCYLLEEVGPDGIVVIKNADVLENELTAINEVIVLCGHSHCPRIVSTRSKTLINAGSVGLPAYSDDSLVPHRMETHNVMARYCILDIKQKITIEQVALEYDFNAAATRADQNHRPDWASWIRTGRVL